MGLLRSLKFLFSPLKVIDPDFGALTFMYIAKHPERSYWECMWNFPPTDTSVFISLSGGESGPDEEARKFYLSLPSRYDFILKACRPKLEQVFRNYRSEELPQDMFTVLRLSGFEVEEPLSQPVLWSVSFETTDDNWLAMTVPFIGDTPQNPEVDT